jgi:hypothetical protein
VLACACASRDGAYVEVGLLDVLEEDGNRVLARLIVVDVAGAVRGQISMAVLVLGDLEFAANRGSVVGSERLAASSPRTPRRAPRHPVQKGASPPAEATGAGRW